MFSWIAQTTIVSIILILLIHHLIHFFKSTLTVPKVKDMFNSPIHKYETMFQSLKENENNNNNLEEREKNYLPTTIPKPDVESMKNELKTFLKQQQQNQNQSGSNNYPLETTSTSIESLGYSVY